MNDKNFLARKDRFDFFEAFENPLLNITFKLEVEDFVTYCKSRNLPPFHFFLFHLFGALKEVENFRYRIFKGEIIKIEEFNASYTVINEQNLFNYTRFENSTDMHEFISRSLKARDEAVSSTALINTGAELQERDFKNYVFITSIPWLDFTSIQHPVFKFKSADIPSVAWGKFTKTEAGLAMPFSVQAHHGFVDAFHIYELSEKLKARISEALKN